jgi:hypothetical protein
VTNGELDKCFVSNATRRIKVGHARSGIASATAAHSRPVSRWWSACVPQPAQGCACGRACTAGRQRGSWHTVGIKVTCSCHACRLRTLGARMRARSAETGVARRADRTAQVRDPAANRSPRASNADLPVGRRPLQVAASRSRAWARPWLKPTAQRLGSSHRVRSKSRRCWRATRGASRVPYSAPLRVPA